MKEAEVSPSSSPSVARLRALLDVTRLVRAAPDEAALLESIARLVSDSLGFRTAVLNLYRPEWDDLLCVAVHGSDAARDALLGGTPPASAWAPLLDPRHAVGGVQFVPAGTFDWSELGPPTFVPDLVPRDHPDAWHPEDALLVPLRDSAGELLALLSVDEPLTGLRPSEEEIEVLTAVGAHVALALESAREAAETARHRLALERLAEVSGRVVGSTSVDEVLTAICAGAAAALGFDKAAIELLDGGVLAVRAASGWDDAVAAGSGLSEETLGALVAAADEIEGCYLLDNETARSLGAGTNPLHGSVRNGRGTRGWNRHWLFAPLHGRGGELSGVIWLEDPADRLLPTPSRLQVLRMFANEATDAVQAALDFAAARDAAEARRAVIDSSPLAILDLDSEGNVRAWNPAARRIFGWREEEVVGRFNPIVPPAEQDASRELLRRALAGESLAGIEAVRQRRDGSRVDVALHVAPVRDARGRVTGITSVIEDITERKAAERALLESEARNSAIMRCAPDCVVLVDERGAIVEFNPAAEETFGWMRAEAVGRDLGELIELPAGVATFAEYLGGDGALLVGSRLELTGVRADGSRFPLEFALTRVDGGGEPLLVAYARDVARRRQADDRLREMEAKYRTLVEGLPLVTYVNAVSDEIRTSYVSPQIEALLGYPTAEWLSSTLFERLLHPDDRERVLAEAARTRASGAAFRCEYRLVGADGQVVHVLDETVTVCDEAGRPLFLQGYLLDLRERRAAEEALRQSEELYRLVVENSLDAICVLDGERNVRYASPSHEPMLGYRVDELVGLNLRDFVHADDLEHLLRYMAAPASDTGASARLRHADGRWIEVEGSASVVTMGGEEMLLVVSRDVTERGRLELQLRQAQKMEAVGRLAGGVAHDFNNLLTAIGGYADYVLRGLNVNDPLRQDALEIKHAADRASELTQQLLAFSRQQVLQARILDLGEVVRNVDGLLRRLIGEDVALEVAIAPELGPVKADRGQLEQVIVNLALNARDAMPGGGRLRIACEEVELSRPHGSLAPGSYIALAVEDTGHGFDEETKARLFEPFFTTKGPGKGTGLGLATVHGIVEQSGGTVDVWSEPNRGTRFTIYLPRAGEAPQLVQLPGGAAEAAERPDETILLVEDEDAVRALARRILTAEGYTVLEARNGSEALELCELRAGRIDAVVTDVVMPNMSGSELVARLAQLRPGVRALFMSGYTDDAIVHHGVLDPEVAFLAKPFTAATLAARVRETLDRGAPEALGTVLVVEDEEALRELIRIALAEAGYEVVAARGPTEALEAVGRGTHVDLLLTDIFMPRMSGRELSHRLSALQPDMRLLYMSGKPDDVLLDVGVVASGEHFLEKPFTLDELRARVRSVLAEPVRKSA